MVGELDVEIIGIIGSYTVDPGIIAHGGSSESLNCQIGVYH